MFNRRHRSVPYFVAALMLALAGCGGGNNVDTSDDGGGGGSGSGGGGSGPTYTIGGTVTGLTGSVSLQLNGTTTLGIGASGSFTFANAQSGGSFYSVAIATQPATQNCSVQNATGTVAQANVTNVAVSCLPRTVIVSGAVFGLTGTGLVLRNNGINQAVSANGTFSLGSFAQGASYALTVATQPAGQTCMVTNGSGTVGALDISSIAVACVAVPAGQTFTVGGTVSGLAGDEVELRINGSEDLHVAANGAFTFSTRLADGAAYAVTIVSQPSNPTQVCAIAPGTGSGTVNGANVASVTITCTTPAPTSFTVGGTVSGLASDGLVLLVNDQEILTVASGATTFVSANQLNTGFEYSVAVRTQPTGHFCTVASNSGTIAAANITNVAVTCTAAQAFTLGGTVSGLTTAGLTLQLNGGDDTVSIPANATSFAFPKTLVSGAQYSVNAQSLPPNTRCDIDNAFGAAISANVTNIAIACEPAFRVSVTISGLPDPINNPTSGLRLRLNGSDDLFVFANGQQVFSSLLPTGTQYVVTVAVSPQFPRQRCVIANGTGTIGTSDVLDVTATCTDGYDVGGFVTGLKGQLVLGTGVGPAPGPSITVQGDGVSPVQFFFPDLLPNNTGFFVFVQTQPPGQTCVASRYSGVVDSRSTTGIGIQCVANVTTPLSGTYVFSNVQAQVFLSITFFTDGTYVFLSRLENDGCGQILGDEVGGVEYGAYRWNSPTQEFQILNAVVDTNGPCGIVNSATGAAFTGTLTKAAANNTITLSNGVGNRTYTAVPSTPNNALLGSFGGGPGNVGANGNIIAFLPDGSYFATFTGERPVDTLEFPGVSAGIEHACYTANATTLTANFSANCVVAGGFLLIDSNGAQGGLSRFNGQPVPYSATATTLTRGVPPAASVQARVLVNPIPAPSAGNFTVGGTVNGLEAETLRLVLNGDTLDNQTPGNGGFGFENGLADGTPYAVVITQQPTGQRCTVSNGTGVIAGADVTNVVVDCVNGYTISGVASGLSQPVQLTALLNGGFSNSIDLYPGMTTFTYGPLPQGTKFAFELVSQPLGQTCILGGYQGTLAANSATGLRVLCVDNVTSPLSGSYMGGDDDSSGIVTFFPDGRYTLLLRELDDGDECLPGDAPPDGIEYGVYHYDAQTGDFYGLATVVDQTGECGLVDSTGADVIGHIERIGDTLRLTDEDPDDPSDATFVPVPSMPGSLIGSFIGTNGNFTTFLPDLTFFDVVTSDALVSSADAFQAGGEIGCYTLTTATITVDLSDATCDVRGLPPVDFNGDIGLSTAGGPFPFAISGDLFFRGVPPAGVTLQRTLPTP